MQGIVAGKTNKVIASELDVSLRTVEYRKARLMKKMEVATKADLVAMVLATVTPSNV